MRALRVMLAVGAAAVVGVGCGAERGTGKAVAQRIADDWTGANAPGAGTDWGAHAQFKGTALDRRDVRCATRAAADGTMRCTLRPRLHGRPLPPVAVVARLDKSGALTAWDFGR